MNIYLLAAIIYASIILLLTIVGYINNVRDYSYGGVPVFLVIYLFLLISAPFITPIALYIYVFRHAEQFERFTIHELTEENKITLRNLGFQEGDFISTNNIPYSGFKKDGVHIQNNGRVFARYRTLLSRKRKHLLKQIRNLVDPQKEIDDIKRHIENAKTFIKYKKDYMKRDRQTIKEYQEKVKDYEQELESAKQKYNLKENKKDE